MGGTAGTERVARAEVVNIATPVGVVAVVTLRSPDDGPATLGPVGLQGLREVLLAQHARATVGELAGVVLTGSGRHLCAGADLRVVRATTTAAAALELGRLGHATLRLLGELGVPSLGLINGTALGGGLELALHCTYRVAARDVTAIGLPETALGLVPGWGGCTLLPALVGPADAVDLVLDRPLAGAATITADHAAAIGLVDALLDRDPTTPDGLLRSALAWFVPVLAGEPVPRPTAADAETWRAAVDAARGRLDRRLHGAAPAPLRAWELIAAARDTDREDAFRAEDDALAELLPSPQLRAGLYAAELVRDAHRAGRPAQPGIRTVGLLGAGTMASQLAVELARRDVAVVLREVDEERVAAGRARIEALVARLARTGTVRDAPRLGDRITLSTDLSQLAGAELVIEAVTEDLAVKRQVLAELEQVVAPTTVLATNTSALSVGAMADGLVHPGRVVGLHVFNPVARMALVEVVRAPRTTPEAVAAAREVARLLGKAPVLVADRPGFVVNRLLLRLLGEVLTAVDSGTDVQVADRALHPLGLPMGPFALLDLVGLPVARAVLATLRAGLGPRYPESPALLAWERSGRLLVVADAVDPSIAGLVPVVAQPAPLDESGLLERVLAGVTAEIGLLLADGVVPRPQEVDVCLVLGAGFGLHLGGLCPYLDRTGMSVRVLGHRLLAPGVADL